VRSFIAVCWRSVVDVVVVASSGCSTERKEIGYKALTSRGGLAAERSAFTVSRQIIFGLDGSQSPGKLCRRRFLLARSGVLIPEMLLL
jgi:hypothetical protein